VGFVDLIILLHLLYVNIMLMDFSSVCVCVCVCVINLFVCCLDTRVYVCEISPCFLYIGIFPHLSASISIHCNYVQRIQRNYAVI
jgi:hypothetical protein